MSVAVSARRITRNLRGELVMNEMGYIDTSTAATPGDIELPAVMSGEGMATEIILVNPGAEPLRAEMHFISSDGHHEAIILR